MEGQKLIRGCIHYRLYVQKEFVRWMNDNIPRENIGTKCTYKKLEVDKI